MMKNEAEDVTATEVGPQTVAEKSASQVYLHEKCLVFGS